MFDYKIKKFSIKYFYQIKKIYQQSFPKKERFPFLILIFNILKGNSEMYILLNNKKVSSFIYVINYKGMSFILYLATNKKERSKGCGSYLLNFFTEKNKENNIFLNIEEINDNYKYNKVRKKRLEFYANNNFFLTDYLSMEEDSIFHILSNTKTFDLKDYIDLDSKISKMFFCNAATIKKIEKH